MNTSTYIISFLSFPTQWGRNSHPVLKEGRSLQFSWRLCFGKYDCKHWPCLVELLHHPELILCNSHHLAFPPPVVQFKVSCSVSHGWNLLSSTQIMWLVATSWKCLLAVGSQTGDPCWSGKGMRWSRILVLPWEWQKCFIWLMPSHLIFFLNFDFLMYVTIRSWGLVAISLDIGLTCLWFLYWNHRGIFEFFTRDQRKHCLCPIAFGAVRNLKSRKMSHLAIAGPGSIFCGVCFWGLVYFWEPWT